MRRIWRRLRARRRLWLVRRRMVRGGGLRLGGMLFCLAIAALCALAADAEPKRNAFAGAFVDATVWLRAQLFPWDPGEDDRARAVVVALDEKTLKAEEFRDVPRALFGPYFAEAAQKALDHGAGVVAFDFVFAFEAPKRDEALAAAIEAYEAPLRTLFFREGRRGRVVIARTETIVPAPRFNNVMEVR
ncbi:MAG: CHASE2 domain-containing protein, partial [Pseudomonadota bacterium]